MKYSAGIIPFRLNETTNEIEFFLGHPGGNYWNNRHYWAFLKGCVEKDESWHDAAMREFKEESGLTMEDCHSQMLIPLGTVLQNPHKTVIGFGLHYPNIDASKCHSNLTEEGVPEIDKYKWMTYDEVKRCTHNTHLVFYDNLFKMIHE